MWCVSRIYLEESLKAAGEFTDALEDDLADAQKLLAMGPREAEDIRSEIVSKTYKCDAVLRQAWHWHHFTCFS